MYFHRYWSLIDNMLREALILSRNLRVRLLVSCGEQTEPLTLNFLWSLKALCVESLNCSVEAVSVHSSQITRDLHGKGLLTLLS